MAAAGSVGIARIAGCTAASDELRIGSAWEEINEFYFEGRLEAWTGIWSSVIAGEDNPTLVLFEGKEYDFTWVNRDGAITRSKYGSTSSSASTRREPSTPIVTKEYSRTSPHCRTWQRTAADSTKGRRSVRSRFVVPDTLLHASFRPC